LRGRREGIIFIAAAEMNRQTTHFSSGLSRSDFGYAVDNSGQLEPYANSGDFVDMATSADRSSRLTADVEIQDIGGHARPRNPCGMYNQTDPGGSLKRFKASPMVPRGKLNEVRQQSPP